MRAWGAAVVAASALSGCFEAAPCAPEAVALSTGGVLAVNRCDGTAALGDLADPDRFLRVGAGPAWSDDDLTYDMRQGRYIVDGSFGAWVGGGGEATMDGGGWVDGDLSMAWSAGPRGSLRLVVRAPEGADRTSFAFGCQDAERLYGLGARPEGVDHTGKRVLLMTAEQGIGQADYDLDEFEVLRGRIGDSYFPVPWIVGSGGWGLGVLGDAVVEADLCSGALGPKELRVASWSDRLELLLFPSGSVRQAVGDWTLATGPPASAPAWAYGPWIAVQRGTDELLRVAEKLRAEHIPTTALWAQDWIGGREQAFGGYDLYYHWEWDPLTYPDLPGAIAQLHDAGFAFLGYFNPFITEGFREWEEANDRGYLPLRPDGDPWTFAIVDRFGSVIDLTSDEAWDWARAYMDEAPAMGQDGWMCDFGEWMPLDAQLADGRTGLEFHNAYPVQWHRMNMESLDAVLGPGNGLCFGRSGWTGDHAITPVTWGGDQETSFETDDGIPSAWAVGVNLGLSGVARYGSDIAGFSSVHDGPSTEELYLRWISMGAFEPVMRTHDGLAEDENWDWERDAATTAQLRRYARWHLRMQPLWLALDRVYREDGLPMMRHGVLVHPEDAAVRDAPLQHFLGDDLLVAPVLTEGAVERTVVLPAGRWYGLLDHTVWEGPGAVVVPAPATEIPVLARAGSVLPLLDPDVQTTYAATDGTIDAGDRADRLDALAFHGADGLTVLADGERLRFVTTGAPGDAAPSWSDGPAVQGDCTQVRQWDCALPATADERTWRVTWRNDTLVGDGWTLLAEGLAGRRGELTVRFAP